MRTSPTNTRELHLPATSTGILENQSPMTWVWVLVSVGILGFIAYHARMGAVSPRIANPEVTGVPRPVEFLFGWPHWLVLHQVGTVVMMLLLTAACVWAWRRRPAHPYLLMVLASTRVLIAAGRLVAEGLSPREAARAAIAGPLTDDSTVTRGLEQMIDVYLADPADEGSTP